MAAQRDDTVKKTGTKAAGAVVAQFGEQVALLGAKQVVRKSPGAPLVAMAGVVFTPAGGVVVAGGEFAAGAIGQKIGGDAGQEIARPLGAAGTGAAIGAVVAGPVGAASGAALGTLQWAAGRGVEFGVDVSKGQEGSVRITNGCSSKINVYSYDEGDHIQFRRYAEIELSPQQWGDIMATKGVTFGAECTRFRVHVYNSNGNCKTKGGSFYGPLVTAGSHYTWNGSALKRAVTTHAGSNCKTKRRLVAISAVAISALAAFWYPATLVIRECGDLSS